MMTTMNLQENHSPRPLTVCVYCGSGPGTNPLYMEAATELGRTLADNNVRLVYGGGSVGLMGAVSKAVLDHGGEVTGIIPQFLVQKERAQQRVQELIETPVALVSTSPQREDTILVRDPFAD